MREIFDPEKYTEIDTELANWRQGDVVLNTDIEFLHLAKISQPHSNASILAAKRLPLDQVATDPTVRPISDREIEGIVVLTQTCDLIRHCRERPFLQVAVLVKMSKQDVEAIRRRKLLGFAHIRKIADRCLVADLDRIMTIEKAVLAGLQPIHGCPTEQDAKQFRDALCTKSSRFPFPDEFVRAIARLKQRLVTKHQKSTDEGAYLRALREIRVQGIPSWSASTVKIKIWFIKKEDPTGVKSTWDQHTKAWVEQFDNGGRFFMNPAIICTLQEITAQDFVDSDRLELDHLSTRQE